jgi:hypothetical protein
LPEAVQMMAQMVYLKDVVTLTDFPQVPGHKGQNSIGV